MNQVDQAIANLYRVRSRIQRRRYTFSRLLVRTFPNRVVPGAGALGIELAGPGTRPNFLGVGFPRTGTTSVYFLLRQHPEVSFPKVGTKELHFFDEANPLYTPAWYFNQFEENTAVGEFTPKYIRVPESRDRIYEMLGPEIKDIVPSETQWTGQTDITGNRWTAFQSGSIDCFMTCQASRLRR